MHLLLSRRRHPNYPATGSIARDHLASERTFLAWIRTGLGFIALGIAIERFSQLDLDDLVARLDPARTNRVDGHEKSKQHSKQQPELLVGTLLGTGTGSIVYGTARYFLNLRMLERGLFKPAYHGPVVLSIGVGGWGLL